jgi:hypothetical protein
VPWPTCEEGYQRRKLTLFASQVVNDFKNIPSLSGGGILEAVARFKGRWWFCNHWLPPEMVLNFKEGDANIDWYDANTHLSVGTTPGSWAALVKWVLGGSWDRKRYFSLLVLLSASPNQIVHLLSGTTEDPTASNNPSRHIGFKAVGNNLYGTVGNGSTEATLLLETLPEGGGFRWLECVLIPGEECRFYVDGVDKGAITTNLPTGGHEASALFLATLSITQTDLVGMDVYEVRVFQEE